MFVDWVRLILENWQYLILHFLSQWCLYRIYHKYANIFFACIVRVVSSAFPGFPWCIYPYSLGLLHWHWAVNSLAPGKFEWNFKSVIFKQILVIDGWGISCKIALIWMSLDFADDQSTLVQVMAWCRQATSHYLSQCWPRSLSPYGVTRSQWVNRVLFFHGPHWFC